MLPHIVAAGRSAVVNTASIGSERGLAGACAYNAAKHGAAGLTRTAASEVAQKGVRVNCVMPRVSKIPLLVGMLEQMFDGDVERGTDTLGKVATLNRVASPREVGRRGQLPPQRRGQLRRQVADRRRRPGHHPRQRVSASAGGAGPRHNAGTNPLARWFWRPKEIDMLGKIIGAVAGAQASKYSRSVGGTGGALIGALAVPLLRRMSWPTIALLAAGGYVVNKLNEKGAGTRY